MTLKEVARIFSAVIAANKYQTIFGFACFFGSLNINSDLDFFIVPRENIKKGKFLKTLVMYFKEIKMKLKNSGHDAIMVPHSTFEEEVKYIGGASFKNNLVVIHISSFPDIHPISQFDILSELKKARFVLIGDCTILSKIKKSNLDYYYNYLFIGNCLLSNYPKQLEKDKIFNKVNYIYKHVAGKNVVLNGTAEKIFFDCCNFLDKQVK